jgi:iron complex transport system ATP-binding protein
MTELAASGLNMSRGGKAIIRNVSFRAESGEFVAIIGANGAGKSTLLALLAGLITPDAGQIQLDRANLANLTRVELARRRAYLPQNPRCEWPISVQRLIALGLTPRLPPFGGLTTSVQARVREMLVEWDLVAHAEQAATTLSGGELARAMLARALVGNPDVLIADEPISGLDPRHALETVGHLRELAHRGKLVVTAIHDLTLAARYATRIVALDHGSVAADGLPGTTLTPQLLRSAFEVEACVSGAGGGAFVDYLSSVAPRVLDARQVE